MPDDETNNETSEPRDEAAESAEPAAEVAADNAAAESADPGADEQPPAEEPAAEEARPSPPPRPRPRRALLLRRLRAEDEAPAEPAAEESAAEEEPAEEEAPAPRRSEPAAEKKDVIPGADLEPIAVEPTGPALSAEEKARLEAEEEEKARREAARLAAEEESDTASRAPAKMEAGARFLATGKRKCSIARVTLLPGDGKVEINKRSLEEFFPRPLHQTMAVQPLTVSGYEGNVDVRVRVHGGGISGQAGAVRHGIARALIEIDSELRSDLKRRGFLTRDARVKERRKAGFKKARKKPQFSKR